MPVTININSCNCLSLSFLIIARNGPNSVCGKILCKAAVASRTTLISVGEPRPDLRMMKDTIFLYRATIHEKLVWEYHFQIVEFVQQILKNVCWYNRNGLETLEDWVLSE